MTKHILLSTILAMTLGTLSAQATETVEIPFSSEVSTQNTIQITVEGKNIRVRGAEGEQLEIYSLTGRRIAVINIDSPDKTIDFNESGCFIVKVKKVTRKITLS